MKCGNASRGRTSSATLFMHRPSRRRHLSLRRRRTSRLTYATPVQPMAAMPAGYPPGTVPIMVAAPPQAPAKRSGVGTILAVLAVAALGYYFYIHRTPTAPPAPPTPPAATNAALTKQQAFSAHWQTLNGFIQISNGAWKNNATVPIQSATPEA